MNVRVSCNALSYSSNASIICQSCDEIEFNKYKLYVLDTHVSYARDVLLVYFLEIMNKNSKGIDFWIMERIFLLTLFLIIVFIYHIMV